MGTEQDLRRIAELAAEAADKAAQGRDAALAPLLREMQALGEVLPGLPPHLMAQTLELDAEIEAGFDNMPV
jgi:hypothetical protein